MNLIKIAYFCTSPSHVEAFRIQIERYLDTLKSTAFQNVHRNASGVLLLRPFRDALSSQFGISFQILDLLCHLSETQTWSGAQRDQMLLAVIEVCDAARLQDVAPETPAVCELAALDERVTKMFAFTGDPRARIVAPMDLSGWLDMLESNYSACRIDLVDSESPPICPERPLQLTESQAEVARALLSFWRLKRNPPIDLDYHTRPHPLIVAPSGCGKSALVRHFAESIPVPVADFNCGTWLITGSRHEPQTLVTIAEFIEKHPAGILFIDELDKISGRETWTRSIQQELYALLDGRTLSFPSWTNAHRAKLKSSFLIIGAGTWQSLYACKNRTIGFDPEPSRWSIPLDSQTSIPEELLYRFNADVQFLQPMSFDEYRFRIARIREQLDFEPLSLEGLDHLALKALESGKHNRWLEAYASRLARAHTEAICDLFTRPASKVVFKPKQL